MSRCETSTKCSVATQSARRHACSRGWNAAGHASQEPAVPARGRSAANTHLSAAMAPRSAKRWRRASSAAVWAACSEEKGGREKESEKDREKERERWHESESIQKYIIKLYIMDIDICIIEDFFSPSVNSQRVYGVSQSQKKKKLWKKNVVSVKRCQKNKHTQKKPPRWLRSHEVSHVFHPSFHPFASRKLKAFSGRELEEQWTKKQGFFLTCACSTGAVLL